MKYTCEEQAKAIDDVSAYIARSQQMPGWSRTYDALRAAAATLRRVEELEALLRELVEREPGRRICTHKEPVCVFCGMERNIDRIYQHDPDCLITLAEAALKGVDK